MFARDLAGGLVAVPVNAKLHPKEFAWIFDNAQTPLVFADPKLAGSLGHGPEIVATDSPDYVALLAASPVAPSDTISIATRTYDWITSVRSALSFFGLAGSYPGREQTCADED
jgi:acyl-CoA synthetase (AMP-forming)/AMP-acid ligase II